MRAWRCHGFHGEASGAVSALLRETVPVPQPGHEQVLVRVHFSSPSPADLDLITGHLEDTLPVRGVPFVPGFDFAGEVCQVGPGCRKLAVGDRVVCCLADGGGFAEFCVCPESQAVKVPDAVQLFRVAGLPLAGLTAFQALFTGGGESTQGEALGCVKSASKVLVLGGNRGIGHLAVQMAVRKGAVVATTVPPGCIHWMVNLGASRVINFRQKHWVEYLKGENFDLILDCVGWATTSEEMDQAAECLKPGGQYITTNGRAVEHCLGVCHERGHRFFKAVVPKVVAADLASLVEAVSFGDLEVAVDQLCSSEELRHALLQSATGQCRGKVLLYEACAPHVAHPGPHRIHFPHMPRVSLKFMNAWECSGSESDSSVALWSKLTLQERPVPVPGQAQALVKVHFVGLDPMDLHLLAGNYRDIFPVGKGTFVPGFDVAGEVVSLDPGCSKLAVGDKVVLCLGIEESCCEEATFGPAGACAEFCICPERQMSKVPDNVVLSKVAGLPLSGLTAYQALFTGKGSSTKGDRLGRVDRNSRVLVLGGNRGCGHIAVQLAHHVGAHVATTVPPSCIEWMFQLGANRVVNFREESFLQAFKDEQFDLILDSVGWLSSRREMDVVVDMMSPGGQYISTCNFSACDEAGPAGERLGRFFRAMVPRAHAEDLDILVGHVLAGHLALTTDQICPFSDLRHALRETVAGQCKGKVLLCQCGATRRAELPLVWPLKRSAMPRPKLTHSVMSAWQCSGFDSFPDAAIKGLRLTEHAPLPSLEDGEAMVRVLFAAADRVDVKLITGTLGSGFPVHKMPFVPGFDAAGEVVAVGATCTKVKVGDRVVCCMGVRESLGRFGEKPPAFGPAGAFAEYCACPESQMSKVPPEVLLSEVAGLPLSGLTAYQGLFTGKGQSTHGECLGATRKGDKVLILGGNRGVGHLAVQMAVRRGAEVTTTVPPTSLDWMGLLGVDRAIDFREQNWVHALLGQEFDLVFDCVGWATTVEELDLAAGVLRPGGLYISDSNFDLFNELGTQGERLGRIFRAFVPKVDAEDLDLLVEWVDNYRLHVEVDEVCRFSALPHALRESTAGQCRGKVLVCQRDSSMEAGTIEARNAFVGGA